MLSIFKKKKIKKQTQNCMRDEMHESMRYPYLAAVPAFALPTSASRVKLLKD